MNRVAPRRLAARPSRGERSTRLAYKRIEVVRSPRTVAARAASRMRAFVIALSQAAVAAGAVLASRCIVADSALKAGDAKSIVVDAGFTVLCVCWGKDDEEDGEHPEPRARKQALPHGRASVWFSL